MASSSAFTSAEDARQYLANLSARGEIKLSKPAGELSASYAKRTANALRRQERAGKILKLQQARGHAAGEGKPKAIRSIKAKGKNAARKEIGPAPTHLKGERDTTGKLITSGVYRGARTPQVPDLLKLVNQSSKTNVITIGVYGYVSFYYDASYKPGIQWLSFVADKQEFLADLQRLNTGQYRDAQDQGLRELVSKYMTLNRPQNFGVSYEYIFRWSARDAIQPPR